MFRFKVITILMLSMLLALSACNLPRLSSVPPAPPTSTNTPLFTLTSSNTPLPTFTFTLSIPLVSVSLETNCRTGPGTAYDLVGNGLQVGQIAEVLGRDSSGQYWIIRDPDRPSVICWLWGQYATVTGDWQSLLVMTPPPTPTPMQAFTFSYRFWGVGPGYQCFMFDVTNTGELTWESYTLTLDDTTHGDTGTTSVNEFITYDGWCSPTVTLLDLTPGETGTATVIMHIMHSFSGDQFDVTLTLCSANGLTGSCLTQSITFIF